MVMGTYACNMLIYPHLTYPLMNDSRNAIYSPLVNFILKSSRNLGSGKLHCQLIAPNVEQIEKTVIDQVEKPRFKWVEIGRNISEAQKKAIAELPPKMAKRCKALMRQIISFTPQKGGFSDLLAAWVRIMKPRRADWLTVLKELRTMDHPLYLKVLVIFFHVFMILLTHISSYNRTSCTSYY